MVKPKDWKRARSWSSPEVRARSRMPAAVASAMSWSVYEAISAAESAKSATRLRIESRLMKLIAKGVTVLG